MSLTIDGKPIPSPDVESFLQELVPKGKTDISLGEARAYLDANHDGRVNEADFKKLIKSHPDAKKTLTAGVFKSCASYIDQITRAPEKAMLFYANAQGAAPGPRFTVQFATDFQVLEMARSGIGHEILRNDGPPGMATDRLREMHRNDEGIFNIPGNGDDFELGMSNGRDERVAITDLGGDRIRLELYDSPNRYTRPVRSVEVAKKEIAQRGFDLGSIVESRGEELPSQLVGYLWSFVTEQGPFQPRTP